MELEKQIENPDNNRIRIVEGKDLMPAELQKKINDVSALRFPAFSIAICFTD